MKMQIMAFKIVSLLFFNWYLLFSLTYVDLDEQPILVVVLFSMLLVTND